VKADRDFRCIQSVHPHAQADCEKCGATENRACNNAVWHRFLFELADGNFSSFKCKKTKGAVPAREKKRELYHNRNRFYRAKIFLEEEKERGRKWSTTIDKLARAHALVEKSTITRFAI